MGRRKGSEGINRVYDENEEVKKDTS